MAPGHRAMACPDVSRGDARTLYRSIHRLFALPGETRIFVAHTIFIDGLRVGEPA